MLKERRSLQHTSDNKPPLRLQVIRLSTKHQRLSQRRKFCDCGDKSHKHTETAKRTTTVRPRLCLPRVRKPSSATEDDTTDRDSESADDDETVPEAPVCGAGKKLKVARSRRPVFLKKWYRDNNDIENDDDDEEPAKTEPALTAHASTAGTPEEEQHIEANSVEMPQTARDTATEAVANAAQYRAALALWETHAKIEWDQEASHSDAHYTEAWQSKVQRVSQIQMARVQAANAAKQSSADTSSLERKRSADSISDERHTKKRRVDIDLTVDDNDDLVEIKKEDVSVRGGGLHDFAIQQEDNQDIEADQKAVNLELREVLLERKKAELERQLKYTQRRLQASKKIKDEEFIKIED